MESLQTGALAATEGEGGAMVGFIVDISIVSERLEARDLSNLQAGGQRGQLAGGLQQTSHSALGLHVLPELRVRVWYGASASEWKI